MRTIVEPLPHDEAVLAALRATGRPTGFAEAPAGALDGVLNRTGPDYYIAFPIGGGQRSGSMGDPYSDVDLVYQITTVGRTGLGVRQAVGEIEPALLGTEVDGRSVIRVRVPDFADVRPDQDVGPPHPFYATPMVRLWTQPA